MRVIVMFDLPTETAEDKRAYRTFRKSLIKSGFVMMQESVYCKLITSPSAFSSVEHAVKKNKPDKGIVQLLTVTEKQFASMEYITGEWESDVITTAQRLVIL